MTLVDELSSGFYKKQTKTAAPPQSQVVREIECVRADTIEQEPITWLWEYRIAQKKLCVFAGPPDTGKSVCSIDIVARLTRGNDWPDGAAGPYPSDVLMLISEDDLNDTVTPRLTAAGADLTKVHFAMKTIVRDTAKREELQIALDADLGALEKLLSANRLIRLIVIDPISSYFGKLRKNDDGEIRHVLIQMKDFAERNEIAVISIDHFNKNFLQSGLQRVSGAGALVQVPRSVWCFVKDPDDEEEMTRLMLNAKLNVVAEAKKAGLKYEFSSVSLTIKDVSGSYPIIKWLGASAGHLDSVLKSEADPEKGKGAACAEWIKSRLARGRVRSPVIYAEAEEAGYSKNTFRRATVNLIDHVQERDGWYMELLKPKAETLDFG